MIIVKVTVFILIISFIFWQYVKAKTSIEDIETRAAIYFGKSFPWYYYVMVFLIIIDVILGLCSAAYLLFWWL